VYLEPTERVWRLQMSCSPLGRANIAPSNPLAGFDDHCARGKRAERKGREKERKRKKWDARDGRHPFPLEINFWLQRRADVCATIQLIITGRV